MKKLRVSHVCLLVLLALRQITSAASATNTTAEVTTNITTTASSFSRLPRHPVNVTVSVGEPANFSCEAAPSSNITLTLNDGTARNLSCPGQDQDYPIQALYGICETSNEGIMAAWTIRQTSFSDNGTKVICLIDNVPGPAAVLWVHDDHRRYAYLIGLTIGGFFGILLVIVLSYTLLRESETLQKCFRPQGQNDDDTLTIVSKE